MEGAERKGADLKNYFDLASFPHYILIIAIFCICV